MAITSQVATLRALRALALICLTTVLGACASAGGGKFVDSALTPLDGEPRGWLVATIGVYGEEGKLPPFRGNQVRFRSLSGAGRETGGFYAQINDIANAPREGMDVVDGNKLQKVIVMALRPGRYEITGGYMSTDAFSYQSGPGFAHPFEIRADQITYAGSYLARVMMGENRMGMEIRSGAYYEIRNQQQRDLGLARQREPALPADGAVIEAIPRPRALAAGMFLFVD